MAMHAVRRQLLSSPRTSPFPCPIPFSHTSPCLCIRSKTSTRFPERSRDGAQSMSQCSQDLVLVARSPLFMFTFCHLFSRAIVFKSDQLLCYVNTCAAMFGCARLGIEKSCKAARAQPQLLPCVFAMPEAGGWLCRDVCLETQL